MPSFCRCLLKYVENLISGGLEIIFEKKYARGAYRDLRVADVVLLMKRDGVHPCWQILVMGNFLCWQTGAVTTSLNIQKVSAIWVWRIFQIFIRKIHGEP